MFKLMCGVPIKQADFCPRLFELAYFMNYWHCIHVGRRTYFIILQTWWKFLRMARGVTRHRISGLSFAFVAIFVAYSVKFQVNGRPWNIDGVFGATNAVDCQG